FCGVANCANGESPEGALLRDPEGNIFGTVAGGAGLAGAGGVFELSPNGDSWSETQAIALCTADGCPFGGSPESGVIMDAQGDLYGTATAGGNDNAGTVFELIPNSSRTKWKAKLLHSFCSAAGCADGWVPNALTYAGQSSGALYDGASPLYGTTFAGGSANGGVAFALIPPQPGKTKWKQKVIHNFCSPNSTDNCTSDGATPQAGMTMDGSGNLYGTAQGAGLNHGGIIFELVPKANSWKEKILYNFCSQPSCADGGGPIAPLLMDADGNLLGVAGLVVFKFSPRKAKMTALYTFCGDGTCDDGEGSTFSLTMDPSGNLFGTSWFGGGHTPQDAGVAWALDPGFQDLYKFCQITSCKDGWNPSSPLLLDGTGNLIGTTWQGGAHGAGNVYELTP
ncbi:MAG: hypothetical protein JO261_12365, partial [Alphaproteobacteria bacterium]|nr:hypothetical protein [Alphaproteobacteria bacterium]